MGFHIKPYFETNHSYIRFSPLTFNNISFISSTNEDILLLSLLFLFLTIVQSWKSHEFIKKKNSIHSWW